MSVLFSLSQCILPLLVLSIAGYGIWKKVPVYASFIRGAKEGIRTAAALLPTLVGLMTAVGVLSASGFLSFLGRILETFVREDLFPAPLIPLALPGCSPTARRWGCFWISIKNTGQILKFPGWLL